MLVSAEKVRTLLKFDGVTVDFTDDELQVLIDSKIDELEGLIGADIRPHDRQKTIGKFKGKVLELNFYPVIRVVDVIVNGFSLPDYAYYVNEELGIIYFHHRIRGHVVVYYTTGIPDRDFTYSIAPLIKDMVAYTLEYGKGLYFNRGVGGDGRISSLKEGDVTVGFSYDSNLSLGGRINNRIDDLKNKYNYSTRIRWI